MFFRLLPARSIALELNVVCIAMQAIVPGEPTCAERHYQAEDEFADFHMFRSFTLTSQNCED